MLFIFALYTLGSLPTRLPYKSHIEAYFKMPDLAWLDSCQLFLNYPYLSFVFGLLPFYISV